MACPLDKGPFFLQTPYTLFVVFSVLSRISNSTADQLCFVNHRNHALQFRDDQALVDRTSMINSFYESVITVAHDDRPQSVVTSSFNIFSEAY